MDILYLFCLLVLIIIWCNLDELFVVCIVFIICLLFMIWLSCVSVWRWFWLFIDLSRKKIFVSWLWGFLKGRFEWVLFKIIKGFFSRFDIGCCGCKRVMLFFNVVGCKFLCVWIVFVILFVFYKIFKDVVSW